MSAQSCKMPCCASPILSLPSQANEPLAKYGVDILQVPEPFNFFQNGPVTADGRMSVTDPISQPGDHLVLKAMMDVVCALSPCPQDIIPGNGLVVTDMRVAVTDAQPDDAALEALKCS